MSTPVKFKLRMVKFLEDPLTDSTPNKYAKEFSNLRVTTNDIEPTGIRKHTITVYNDLSSVSDIVSKISEYFSNEKCDKFSLSGDSLTYEEDQGITVDTEELTEKIKGHFENLEKYGRSSWSCQFDAQGSTEVEWTTSTAYIAQLIITDPVEEPPVMIYPQEYKD